MENKVKLREIFRVDRWDATATIATNYLPYCKVRLGLDIISNCRKHKIIIKKAIKHLLSIRRTFPGGSVVKNVPAK